MTFTPSVQSSTKFVVGGFKGPAEGMHTSGGPLTLCCEAQALASMTFGPPTAYVPLAGQGYYPLNV